jgi:poly-gamma-glutamate synthesis protein (capsule biosynthesis protein)
LAFLGDVMLGRGVTPGEDSLAYLTPYLQAADLALANLESPLAIDSRQNLQLSTFQPYNLCAPPERVRFLAEAGLDLLSLANNHSLDCGEEGLAATRSTLHAAGLTALGSAGEPVYRTINGLRLAFLAFEDVSAPLDGEAAAQLIRGAHDTGALVIVSIHWGMEYQGGPSERQCQLAQQFVDAGAVLIWGHHPHVLQPAEWMQPPAGSAPSSPPQGKPAGGSALVLYSLGNALFDQGGLADTRQSALVLVELDENGVRSAHVIPFEIDIQHSRVQAADEQVAQEILEHLKLK